MSTRVLLQAPVLYQGVAGSLSPESTLVSRRDPFTPDGLIACIDLPSTRRDASYWASSAFVHERMPMTQSSGQFGSCARRIWLRAGGGGGAEMADQAAG